MDMAVFVCARNFIKSSNLTNAGRYYVNSSRNTLIKNEPLPIRVPRTSFNWTTIEVV